MTSKIKVRLIFISSSDSHLAYRVKSFIDKRRFYFVIMTKWKNIFGAISARRVTKLRTTVDFRKAFSTQQQQQKPEAFPFFSLPLIF